MELNEIITAAANGVLPDGLNMAEKLLYYQAKELYVGFKNGDISKEQGAKMKQAYIADYRQNMSKLANGLAAQQRWGKFFTAVEGAFILYRREKTDEAFKHFHNVIYGFEKGKE